MNKKKLKEFLDGYFLNHTGYRKINGGFAEVRIDEIKKVREGIYKVEGYLKSGVDDTGDGHSETYTDVLEDLFVDKDYHLLKTGEALKGMTEEEIENIDD